MDANIMGISLFSDKASGVAKNPCFFDQNDLPSKEDYLHGSCHIFAIALEELGLGKIAMILEFYGGEAPIDATMLHAFVVNSDNKYFDVRGLISVKDIESEFGLPELDSDYFSEDFALILNAKAEMLKKAEKYEWNIESRRSEIEEIKKFILNHKEQYI